MRERSTRRILFSAMSFFFLMASCASPVPAATQDPALLDRVIAQSVTLTLAAQEAQAKDQQITQLVATLTAAAQQASIPTQTPSTEAETIDVLPYVTEPPAAELPEPASSPTDDPNAPTVETIFPNSGTTLGGDVVTIKGTNFVIGKGHIRFYFGDKEAMEVDCISTTECTVKVPPGTEGNIVVKAELTTDRPLADSNPGTFSYIPLDPNQPMITRITPREGSMRGGITVTIVGRNFLGGELGEAATKFYFGANPATDVVCETPQECKVKSPAGQPGIVIVKAENIPADGSEPIESQHIEGNHYDGFKYNGPATYGCSALTVIPRKGTVLGMGEPFTIKWIITNIGENTWPTGIDVKYSAGVKMSASTVFQIPTALEPNQSYEFDIQAVAPDSTGTFYMSWTVEGMGCDVYVAIDVE